MVTHLLFLILQGRHETLLVTKLNGKLRILGGYSNVSSVSSPGTGPVMCPLKIPN